VVAISEASDASERIKRFAESSAPWIVAVKMVSEGVDIPRLRVGVYATNIQSELFFRQAVGRLVRTVEGLDEQSAYVYIPADTVLVRYALQIKEERDHRLLQESERPDTVSRKDSLTGESNGGGEDWILGGVKCPIFTPLESDVKAHDTIFDGASFSSEDLAHAEAVRREMGLNIPQAHVAALLRRGAAEAGRKSITSSRHTYTIISKWSPPTKAERKMELRKSVQRLANRLARILNVEPRDIHREWISISGASHGDATEENLRRKKAWLIERLNESARRW
jgi:superfamily II DNA or RNA helicase